MIYRPNLSYILISFIAIVYCSACRQRTNNSTPKSTSKTIKKEVVRPATSTKRSDTTKAVVVSDPRLKKLTDQLNDYMTQYDSISPFQNYDLPPLHISAKDMDSSFFDQESGKYSGLGVISYLQDKILDRLGDILDNKHIAEYRLQDILPMETAVSDDGRLYSISFDEKTGGTYRSSISLYQYRAENGSIYNFAGNSGEESSPLIFNHDGYTSIVTISTKTGTKYLMQGSVIGCSTCIGNYIQLIHFKNGKPLEDFSYELHTREGNGEDRGGEIDYDPKKKEIDVSYFTDDETPICACDDYQKQENAGIFNDTDESDYGKPCNCTFVFNGDTFISKRQKKRHHR